MIRQALKLTTYTGERDRAGDAFLADALLDLYGRRGLATSLLVRGLEGFGIEHHMHSARLLTLSEDLPLVTVAVDTRERIEPVLAEVRTLTDRGLVTLERARLLIAPLADGVRLAPSPDGHKLTVYLGRHERAGRREAFLSVVDVLREAGMAGATVLLGVDGTAHGQRRRARFFASNSEVPLMIISIGEGPAVVRALPLLDGLLERPLVTLERVRLVKRDGVRLAGAAVALAATDPRGLPVAQKLMVHSSAAARHDGAPLHTQLMRRLRREGAVGATSMRGVWGFHGDHAPHGDRLWTLGRETPVMTVVVDAPERAERWLAVIDELTDRGGLVTSEIVPALWGWRKG